MPLLLDGAKYVLCEPENEEKLAEIVKEHSKEIFWEGSLFFENKKKIISKSGKGTKPDGYLIDFLDDDWWVIEVELSSHSIEHVVSQLSKFITATKNPLTQKEITDTLHSDIENDPIKEAFVKKRMGSEQKDIHKLLSTIIERGPKGTVVVVEKLRQEIKEICNESLKGETCYVELKTFVRKGARMAVHAHLISYYPTESWEEEETFAHATYDDNEQVFSCTCGDEDHKSSATCKVGEINEHLLLEHGIPYEEQIIDGWTDDNEKQLRRYLANKYLKPKK
jgi:hypothetical protein